MSSTGFLHVGIAIGAAGAVPRDAVASDRDAADTAWRREMERAQLQSWLKPVVAQATPANSGAYADLSGSRGAMPTDMGLHAEAGAHEPDEGWPPRVGTRPTARAKTAVNAWAVVSDAPRGLVIEAGRSLDTASTAVPRSDESRLIVVAPGRGPSAPSASVSRGADQAASIAGIDAIGRHEPVRLAVHTIEGRAANVWLGVDARLVAHAASLAAAIRRLLADHGLETLSVVCNGVPVEPCDGVAGAGERHVEVPRGSHSLERQQRKVLR